MHQISSASIPRVWISRSHEIITMWTSSFARVPCSAIVGILHLSFDGDIDDCQKEILIRCRWRHGVACSAFNRTRRIAELGFPGFEAYSWQGLMAPKGTPDAVIRKLSSTVSEFLTDPSVVAQITRLGGGTNKLSSEEFRKFVKAEIDKWGPIIKKAGAVVE